MYPMGTSPPPTVFRGFPPHPGSYCELHLEFLDVVPDKSRVEAHLHNPENSRLNPEIFHPEMKRKIEIHRPNLHDFGFKMLYIVVYSI